MVLSRIFVPERALQVARRRRPSCRVDVLTRGSPPGATFIASQRRWAGQPRMARRAERSEPCSGVLDGSEQHRLPGRSRPTGPQERDSFARAPSTIGACCLRRRKRFPVPPKSPRPIARKPNPDHIDAERAPNATTYELRCPQASNATCRFERPRGRAGRTSPRAAAVLQRSQATRAARATSATDPTVGLVHRLRLRTAS